MHSSLTSFTPCSLPLENVILDIWSMMEDSRVFKNILTTLEDLPNPPRDEVVYSSLTTLESSELKASFMSCLFYYHVDDFL